MRVMYIGIIRGYMIRLKNSDKKEDPFLNSREDATILFYIRAFIILIHDQSFQTKTFLALSKLSFL